MKSRNVLWLLLVLIAAATLSRVASGRSSAFAAVALGDPQRTSLVWKSPFVRDTVKIGPTDDGLIFTHTTPGLTQEEVSLSEHRYCELLRALHGPVTRALEDPRPPTEPTFELRLENGGRQVSLSFSTPENTSEREIVKVMDGALSQWTSELYGIPDDLPVRGSGHRR